MNEGKTELYMGSCHNTTAANTEMPHSAIVRGNEVGKSKNHLSLVQLVTKTKTKLGQMLA